MNAEDQHQYLSWRKSHKRGKMAAGIIIVLYGTLFLLKEFDVWLPPWTFTIGPVICSIGLVVLIKQKFKDLFGYILLLVGSLFLVEELRPGTINVNIIWPILLIVFGLAIAFRSRRKRFGHPPHHHRGRHHWKHRERWEKHHAFFEAAADLDNIAQDDFIDVVSIFGGVQKNVVSKNFRGADIVTIFGGNELNLSQADFTEQIVMDITNIFGGTTLTIPNNWELKSEIVTIFGSLEDKRPLHPKDTEQPPKIVILRGTCMFGGIEINSFN